MVARVSVLVVVSDLDPFRRLLASLDRQTLPSSDFDVLVADGGLQDVALLHRLASHRPNVRVTEAGVSPWAELVAASTAEAVVPLVDTDTLYQGALAALADEARSSDAVLGKSVRPGARAALWELMTADRAVDPADVDPRVAEGLAVAMTCQLAERAAKGATAAADLRRAAAAEARSVRTLATQLCLRAEPTDDPLPRGENPSVVLAGFVGNELVLTGDVGARYSLRSLETGVEWPLTDVDDDARLRIDVRTAGLGAPLEPGRWVVEATAGTDPPVGVRLRGPAPGAALVGETIVVVRSKEGRRLVIDVGAGHQNPFRPVDLGSAPIVESAGGTRLRLPLRIAHTGQPTMLPATLYVGDFPLHATLAAADGQVALECLLSGVPGRTPLKVAVAESTVQPLDLDLVISNAGDMSLSRTKETKGARSVPPRPRQAASPSAPLRRLTDRISGRSRRT